MASLLNRVQVTVTSAPGTGPLALGDALALYQTISGAGGVGGKQYSYLITEGPSKAEIGAGTWDADTNTFTRDTVLDSTAGYGVKETFGANAIFSIVLLAEDLAALEKRAASKAMGLALVMGG